MKEYQTPQIEVVVFEVDDIVAANTIGSFSLSNLGEWDYYRPIDE